MMRTSLQPNRNRSSTEFGTSSVAGGHRRQHYRNAGWKFGEAQREHVAASVALVALLARRREICRDRQIGLTTLYNDVDEGAHRDLVALHRELEEAVAACYGLPKRVAQDDDALVGPLLALDVEIGAGGRSYDPFGAS